MRGVGNRWVSAAGALFLVGAMQAQAQQFGAEVKCNVGPVTGSTSGSVGLTGGGVGVTVNPWNGEVCAGVNAQGGLGGYGRASVDVCRDGRGQVYVKPSGGVGVGAGVDGVSVGCAVMGNARVPMPAGPMPRQPATMPIRRAQFPGAPMPYMPPVRY